MSGIIKLGIVIVGVIFIQSCTSYNEEDLYPEVLLCDTSNITYSGTITIIMQDNCNECHGNSFPQSGIITNNYDDVKVIADNGKLWGVVNHEEGYTPMPKNRPKLNECDLNKIRIWINNGALNN